MSWRLVKAAMVCVVAGVAVAWVSYAGLPEPKAVVWLLTGTPHQRYAAGLAFTGRASRPEGEAWLAAAEGALEAAGAVTLPREGSVELAAPTVGAGEPFAAAYATTLRRGQRYVVEAGRPAFVDLFVREDGELRHVESAPRDSSSLAVEIAADGEYVVRVQPPIAAPSPATIALRAAPSLRLPVDHETARIDSFFGDPRDSGARRHEGVDIFARRGTPVVAAAGGIVSSVRTTAIGGHVVWVMRPGRRERHYYAHLDEQRVRPGAIVEAGDVIGTVGNSGNARTTPPHLHFGIYGAGGAVDPLPYIAPPRRGA